jgi:hypothetical protein
MSSEKMRVLVFSLFLLALIVFGMVYRPADALSQPAGNSHTAAVVQHSVPIK